MLLRQFASIRMIGIQAWKALVNQSIVERLWKRSNTGYQKPGVIWNERQ
jgi:hypothetical protein